MAINDEISTIANQIANSGKKPTVALIKSKLTKPVPLPTIISSLKSWQHDPSCITLPKEDKQITIEANLDPIENIEFRQILNEELGQMKQEIVELKELIKMLLAQQKNK